MIAILACVALPLASSLYRRNRENALRETLLISRMAIRDFHRNGIDDDADSRVDEDPLGDANHDGFPGIRGASDGVRGADVDAAAQPALLKNGFVNPFFDARFRGDDDEDGLIDEESFPTDLNDLVSKMGLLRGKVPPDPTTGEASWRVILGKLNNDADWTVSGYDPSSGPPTVIVRGPAGARDAAGVVHMKRDGGGAIVTQVLKPRAATPNRGQDYVELTDEDPRDGQDNDGDGLTDEDSAEVIDVRSWNSSEAADGSKYSEW